MRASESPGTGDRTLTATDRSSDGRRDVDTWRRIYAKALLGLSLLAVLAVAASACNAGGSPTPKALKIGLVTDVGGLNDKSFNEASWNGTQDGATKVGGTAQNIVTKAPADYAANIQTFVDQKYDVIVTVGFALGDATLKAATANPSVKFIGVDQFICVPKDAADKTCAGAVPANYQGVIFVEAQAGYLVGVVAGTLTKSTSSSGWRYQHDPAGRELHPWLRERRHSVNANPGPHPVRRHRYHGGLQRAR